MVTPRWSLSLHVALPLAPPARGILPLIKAATHLGLAHGQVVCADIPTPAAQSGGDLGV